jgi:hypothetical protein
MHIRNYLIYRQHIRIHTYIFILGKKVTGL